jgi:hypothetical protein
MLPIYRILILGLLGLCLTPVLWAQPVGNDQLRDVHGLLLQIEHEIKVLRQRFGSSEIAKVRVQQAKWQPMHLWHKAYGLQIQVNILRRQHGLFGFAPVALEPGIKITGPAVLGQLQRVLVELRILRMLLQVEAGPVPESEPKDADLDEVNEHIAEISQALDALNGEPISSSYAYAEAMRLESDLNLILPHLGIDDRAVPPAALAQASSSDSFKAAYELMQEIQRLQQRLGLAVTDFSGLMRDGEALAEDTFNMLLLCQAEMQPLKARLGLAEAITPPAIYRQNKTPSQVTQLLGYMINQMRLIRLD